MVEHATLTDSFFVPFSDEFRLLKRLLRFDHSLGKVLLLVEILEMELAYHVDSAGDVLARKNDDSSSVVANAHCLASLRKVPVRVSSSGLHLSTR